MSRLPSVAAAAVPPPPPHDSLHSRAVAEQLLQRRAQRLFGGGHSAGSAASTSASSASTDTPKQSPPTAARKHSFGVANCLGPAEVVLQSHTAKGGDGLRPGLVSPGAASAAAATDADAAAPAPAAATRSSKGPTYVPYQGKGTRRRGPPAGRHRAPPPTRLKAAAAAQLDQRRHHPSPHGSPPPVQSQQQRSPKLAPLHASPTKRSTASLSPSAPTRVLPRAGAPAAGATASTASPGGAVRPPPVAAADQTQQVFAGLRFMLGGKLPDTAIPSRFHVYDSSPSYGDANAKYNHVTGRMHKRTFPSSDPASREDAVFLVRLCAFVFYVSVL